MKIFTGLLFVLIPILLQSQQIKDISIFPCAECSPEKQIYVLGDTSVYWYNWYTHEYSAMPNTGLIRHDGVVQLSELEAFEDEDADTRLYVISDTAVFYYEWYMQVWYSLPTCGLNRINGKPDLRLLQVFTDRDDDTRVYVVSNDSVMYYEWYYDCWYPIINPVLSIAEKERDNKQTTKMWCYLKHDMLNVEFTESLESETFVLQIVNMQGKVVQRPYNVTGNDGKITHRISVRGLAPGTYILQYISKNRTMSEKFVK